MLEFQSVVDTSSTFISAREVQKNSMYITKLVGFKECKYTTKDGGSQKAINI